MSVRGVDFCFYVSVVWYCVDKNLDWWKGLNWYDCEIFVLLINCIIFLFCKKYFLKIV